MIKPMFFDRQKLIGTLVGVVFAVVLGNIQSRPFVALRGKNRMFVENAKATRPAEVIVVDHPLPLSSVRFTPLECRIRHLSEAA